MIREFIEDQIHIHEILRMHQRLNTIQLIVELCIQHTLLGPEDLIGNVINCIAGSGRYSDHIRQFHLFFHQIIQHATCKNTSLAAALQNHSCFFHIPVPPFYHQSGFCIPLCSTAVQPHR